jgi:hypothetical protein
MSLNNKKLVAILGGRIYPNNATLRRFLIPPIREKLQKDGIDFIIASNNPSAIEQYKQISGLKVVETSPKLHEEFMARQREAKPNLGAETRETINQYAIENRYDYVCHLDDNITVLRYRMNGKNIVIKKRKPAAFYDIMKLLFFVAENSNSGAVGIEMAYYYSTSDEIKITAGFPYSFFVHRVDPNFQFENATEDDILMSIYNGNNGKPSCVIRNAFAYGKTGKKSSIDGNRQLYLSMLKENQRGEYIESLYPDIYARKVSYMVKSSTSQKPLFFSTNTT